MALTESNVIVRHHRVATDRLAKSIDDKGEAGHRLRDEVIRSSPKMK